MDFLGRGYAGTAQRDFVPSDRLIHRMFPCVLRFDQMLETRFVEEAFWNARRMAVLIDSTESGSQS